MTNIYMYMFTIHPFVGYSRKHCGFLIEAIRSNLNILLQKKNI